MTTIDTHPDTAASAETTGLATVAAWLASTDHKRIGRLYLGTGLIGLFGSLVVTLLLAIERLDATGYGVLEDGAITQMVSMSRIGLVFGGMVPILLGLCVAIVPLQIGSRAIALPRLAMAGYWAWLSGLVLVVWSIAANGGPGGGDPQMVDLFLAAMVVLALGALMTAVAVFTTIITNRAPGMSMWRAPLFTWSAFLLSVVIILAVPTLIGTLVYLYVDHRYGRVAFGGNVGILDWIGWAVSQPATYVLAVPAFGILADTAPVAARVRQPQRSGLFVTLGLVTVGALAVVTQVGHTVEGNGILADDGVGFATQAGELLTWALLLGLPVLGALGTIGLAALAQKSGRPRPLAGFVFSFLGAGMMLVGIAGHLLYTIEDLGLQGTVFEEGAFLYVVLGAVMAGLGGLAHWGPKLWGHRLADAALLPLAALALIATVLASLPLYIAGFADQPALVVDGFDYSGPQNLWNLLALVGIALFTLVVLLVGLLATKGFRSGDLAGDDPWDGQTLEWATSSPPPTDNFVEVPLVASAQPLTDLKPSGSDA
jgi:heme/copper-type cytochrome/quinol oxidase subunit 1